MNRRLGFWCVMGLLVWGATLGAREILRIVPVVQGDEVLVSFELADAYTGDVREAISSGLLTTFTYNVELRMVGTLWVDRTIAAVSVSASDQYDNLTRRHVLSRTVNGRVVGVVGDGRPVDRRKVADDVYQGAPVPDRQAGLDSRLLRPHQRPVTPPRRVPSRLDQCRHRPGEVHVHSVAPLTAVGAPPKLLLSP